MKKIISIVLVFIMGMFLVGCGNGESNSIQLTKDKKETKTIESKTVETKTPEIKTIETKTIENDGEVYKEKILML